MKEHPILFSAPMVLAILEGRKTQTRRAVKPQPDISVLKESARDLDFEFRRMPVLGPSHTPAEWGFCIKYDKPECVPIYGYKCPYGQPGDRLWVRENWLVSVVWNKTKPKDIPKDVHVEYQATDESGLVGRTRPSIHMPRWASRITLEITDIKVERLQDISEEDVLAEGLKSLTKDYLHFKFGIPDRDGFPGNDNHGWQWKEWSSDPRLAYQKLWESINGHGSWADNPFVWVVEFKRVEV